LPVWRGRPRPRKTVGETPTGPPAGLS